MTLLTAVFAAAISTAVWYCSARARSMRVGVLCLTYWGASLMWLVDAVFAYAEEGTAVFTPAFLGMLHDFYLGLAVVALGLVIWLIVLLVRDPGGVVRQALRSRK